MTRLVVHVLFLVSHSVSMLSIDILSQLLKNGDPEDAYYEGFIISDNLRRRCLVQLLNSYFDNEHVWDHNQHQCAFFADNPSATMAVMSHMNTTSMWHPPFFLVLILQQTTRGPQEVPSMQPSASQVAGPSKPTSMSDTPSARGGKRSTGAVCQGAGKTAQAPPATHLSDR
jgi:hypothetical protein